MIPMSDIMVNKIKAYSDLFRVENSLTGLIGVVIGAVVVNGIDFSLSDAMIVSFFGKVTLSKSPCMSSMSLITSLARLKDTAIPAKASTF